MSVILSKKRNVIKLWTQLADMNSALQIISEEQRRINSKLDMLIALQQQNNSSLTMQKKPSRRAFQEDEPTEGILDVTRLPKPPLKRPRLISEISQLFATIQDVIDSENNETNADENQETPKRPQATRRSPRLQNKKQKK